MRPRTRTAFFSPGLARTTAVPSGRPRHPRVAPPERDDHHGSLAGPGRDRLDALDAWPAQPGHAERLDVVGSDPAAVDAHDPVRAVLVQARPAGGVDRVLHPGAPAQAVVTASGDGHLLDLDVDLETAEPVELLAHHGGLEVALGRQRGVLPVAPAAQPGRRPRAGRVDPVGRGLEHLDHVGTPEPSAPQTRW